MTRGELIHRLRRDALESVAASGDAKMEQQAAGALVPALEGALVFMKVIGRRTSRLALHGLRHVEDGVRAAEVLFCHDLEAFGF